MLGKYRVFFILKRKKMKLYPILLAIPFLFFYSQTSAQELYQYFDGADTIPEKSLLVEIDSTEGNIWQIGPPQKTIFNAAATVPNVLVTDTINSIPNNDSSSFQYILPNVDWGWGILAVQWTQKLDLDHKKDFGLLEFSVDNGDTWQNAFNNPYVYNFYGFESSNVDTLSDGSIGFTGQDSTWRNIWFCFDGSWLGSNDTIVVRHTLLSDSIDNNNEGWMIDNMIIQMTWIHTIAEKEQEKYIRISPNPSTGRFNIDIKKINGPHIIEHMELSDMNGKLLQKWEYIPTKFFIDLDDYPNGFYYLNIKTNQSSEVHKIMLQK